MYFNETFLGTGTGFFAKTRKGVLLITALHNLTGRNERGKCISKTGAYPNKVRYKGYDYNGEFALYHGDNDPNRIDAVPVFWRHPNGPHIDVAIVQWNAGTVASQLDSSFLDPDYGRYVKLTISQLCCIIGYPEGLFQNIGPDRVLPIWKTGHLASEPSVYENGIPRILIDAATRSGMSGSPVYVRSTPRSLGEHPKNRLLGVYTGRTSEMSDIGFVFTPDAITQIIDNGPMGTPLEYSA